MWTIGEKMFILFNLLFGNVSVVPELIIATKTKYDNLIIGIFGSFEI